MKGEVKRTRLRARQGREGTLRLRRVLAEAVAVFLALNCAAVAGAAVLAHGGRFSPALDVLSHFAVIYVVGALAGIAVAAFLPNWGRRVGLALGGVALGASIGLMAPELLRPRPPAAAPGPDRLKVVQYNALKSNTQLAREVDWILAQHADVVTIQEVRLDLAQALLRNTGWERPVILGDVAIFSRLPKIETPPVVRAERSSLVMAQAAFAHPSGPVEVATLHLDWPTSRAHRQQMADIAGLLRQRPRERMVLTGDFNSAPWSAGLREAERQLGLTRRDKMLMTFPADRRGFRWPTPVLAIDHVYAGPGWATVSVERGPRLGSDHYPVIVTLAPVAPR